jgi:DNA (cytosine-5)-methyltransferase 1
MQPRLCFFENVDGHITLGLREVIGELESMGYAVSWGVFSAAEVGAPHRRKRVFILAHRNGTRLEGYWRPVTEHDAQRRQKTNEHSWPSYPSQPQHRWEPPRVVGNSESESKFNRLSRQNDHLEQSNKVVGDSLFEQNNGRKLRSLGQEERIGACGNDAVAVASEVVGDSRAGQTQPSLGGNLDGTSSGMDYAELCISYDNRTDELRLLGNGVVPATAEKAFRTLIKQIK